MGRTKYSPEEINAIMTSFVTATKEVIESEGIEAASIRRVSSVAGFSSATLYLYFEDMNELIAMSLISYLSDYVGDIIESTPESESSEDAYLRSWELFCMHAFAHPSVYLNLFYGPQSGKIDEIAKKYYELFPGELEQATGTMLNMLGYGNLLKRNRAVLTSFATDLGFSEHEIDLINELTIAYFRSFLQKACDYEQDNRSTSGLVDEFLEGALFVLRLNTTRDA